MTEYPTSDERYGMREMPRTGESTVDPVVGPAEPSPSISMYPDPVPPFPAVADAPDDLFQPSTPAPAAEPAQGFSGRGVGTTPPERQSDLASLPYGDRTMPPALTGSARWIEQELPSWYAEFARKAYGYGNMIFELGIPAQYHDMYRKFGKLKRAMWDGQPLYGEPLEEVIRDLIGHCWITLYLLDQQRKF
jgi:hypothetical protein